MLQRVRKHWIYWDISIVHRQSLSTLHKITKMSLNNSKNNHKLIHLQDNGDLELEQHEGGVVSSAGGHQPVDKRSLKFHMYSARRLVCD